ncbi:MAG: glycosyltransferase family 4 protein [Thermoleophilia bacterium]
MPGPKVAFVVPRYGAGVVGGAEMLCRLTAENLRAHGVPVEVLTTTAVDHFTWADHHPEGTTLEGGVPVHRFRVSPGRDNGRWLELHTRIDLRLPTDRADGLEWMAQSVWSPGLQAAVEDPSRYDWIVAMPYLFGTTFWSVMARPERTVLVPCVHDEAHAWQPVVRDMLGRAAGNMLNSDGEGELLERLAPGARMRLVSVGYDESPPPAPEAVAAFCAARGIAPGYILYAGRRETAKGLPELFDAYARLAAGRPDTPPLALMGRGDLGPPPEIADRVIDLGFVPDEDRDTAYAAARVLVNPSRLESLGMVGLEAWLAGTPSIVNGRSPVLREHCRASGGGLWYHGPDELVEAMDLVCGDPALGDAMAAAGAGYVRRTFSWPAVRARFLGALEEWA